MTPIQQNVVGIKGESVQFQWTVKRDNKSTFLISLDVFNGTGIDLNRKLFALVGEMLTKLPNTPKRLNADIVGIIHEDIEVILTLTLKKLQFEDMGMSFCLAAIFRSPLKEIVTSVTLVKVNGKHFTFYMFSLCKGILLKQLS